MLGVEAEVTDVVVVDDEAVEFRVSECSVTSSSSLEFGSFKYRGSSSRRRTDERGELKLHLLCGLSFTPERKGCKYYIWDAILFNDQQGCHCFLPNVRCCQPEAVADPGFPVGGGG